MSKRKKQDILKAIEKINEDGLRDKKEVNKEVIIKRIMAEYKLTQSTAVTYYYEWKKQYMKTDKCIPKIEKKVEIAAKKEKCREKFIIKDTPSQLKAEEACMVTIDDTESVKEDIISLGGIIEDVVKKEVVKKDTKKLIVSFGVFEGDHAIYTKDSNGVRIGKEKKIYKSKEDVEEYQEELLKEVDSMVQELLKVIELGGIINA